MHESLKPLNSVMLIGPQNGIYTGFQGLVRTEPLGLEYLAGAIAPLDSNQPRLVRDVSIHDDRLQPGGWKERMRQNPPDMIGVQCNYTADVPIVHQLIKDIRQEIGSDTPIVIGGHHISLRPSDVFIDGVDAVAIGPGEGIMQDLVKAWKKERSFRGARGVWYKDEEGAWRSNVSPRKRSPLFEVNSSQMNERPLPRRDLVAQYRKMGDGYYFLYYNNVASVESARGCIGGCGFCTVHEFHQGQYRVQSVERTINEMAALPDDIKYTLFMDDLAFYPRPFKNPRTGQMELYDPGIEFAQGMTERGLQDRFRFWSQIRSDSVYPRNPERRKLAWEKYQQLAQVGLDMTLVGFESLVSAGNLKQTNKGTDLNTNILAAKILQDLGVRLWAAQIIFPGWGVEDYMKVIKANNELKIEAPQFTILTPLPGSVDNKQAAKEGRLTTFNPAHYDFFHWVVSTALPVEETYRLMAKLYQETGGSLTSLDSVRKDLKEGRTTSTALRKFKDRFANMQNAEAHIENLKRTNGTEDIDWVQFLGQNALKYGGPESVLVQAAE